MGLIVSPIQLDNLLGEKYGVVMESNDLGNDFLFHGFVWNMKLC